LNVVALENGTVAVQFSADVREFVFTRPQAIELGVGLITMAARAELVTTHPVLGIVKGRSN
jgi:hypothetical protein